PSYALYVPASAHPPDLLSFPTRRSSDLVRAVKIVRYTDVLPSRMAFEIDAHELCHAIAAVQSIEDPCHAVDHGIVESSVLLRLQDRKSTRLNSSHQIISYAVFCLKKKKT